MPQVKKQTKMSPVVIIGELQKTTELQKKKENTHRWERRDSFGRKIKWTVLNKNINQNQYSKSS